MQRIVFFFILVVPFISYGQQSLQDSFNLQSQIKNSAEITVGKISVTGNKITKDKIVFRELEFKEGEKMSGSMFAEKIVQSRENLLNSTLFNFVTIIPKVSGDIYDIKVEVVERWYIWPIPIFEYADRNFNVWWETKDFSHLNFGLDLRIENFRGRMEHINLIVTRGYDRTLALIWDIPYVNKKQTLGMSISAGSVFNHETAFATEGNKLKYYRTDDNYAKKKYFANITLTYRPKYRFFHSLSLTYDRFIFADSLLWLNPNFTNGDINRSFFSFKYLFKFDFRDYKPYPLNGFYFDFDATKTGLGILGSGINLLAVQTAFDKYFHLHKRWYFAYNVSAMFSWPYKQPYFLSKGLGVHGLEIRGYDLYFVNGQHLGLMKSNLKFELIPKKIYNISWIKTEKFSKIFIALYANVFFDMAYVYDPLTRNVNPLANQMLWSTGVGVDFVTYYDMVFSLDYAVNKQNKSGFFLSLVAPI